MSFPEDLDTSINDGIPKALTELQTSCQNVVQIADYCKSLPSQTNDFNEITTKTQDYIKASLSNVSYHIHSVGLHLTNFLQLQTNELEKLDLQIQVLSDKMKSTRENVGLVGVRTMEAPKLYHTKPKTRRLDESELSENSRMTSSFVRIPLNLKSLDNVGMSIDSQGLATSGSGSFANFSAPENLSVSMSSMNNMGTMRPVSQNFSNPPPSLQTPINRPPPPLTQPPVNNATLRKDPSMNNTNTGTIRQSQSPTPTPPPFNNSTGIPPPMSVPPPPMNNINMGMPPPPPMTNLGMPPPPPTHTQSHTFDMGMPPPPPSFDMGMPPPPPMNDLGMPPPPPMNNGFPPPPPSSLPPPPPPY